MNPIYCMIFYTYWDAIYPKICMFYSNYWDAVKKFGKIRGSI